MFGGCLFLIASLFFAAIGAGVVGGLAWLLSQSQGWTIGGTIVGVIVGLFVWAWLIDRG